MDDGFFNHRTIALLYVGDTLQVRCWKLVARYQCSLELQVNKLCD
jgi:hypothetical protein